MDHTKTTDSDHTMLSNGKNIIEKSSEHLANDSHLPLEIDAKAFKNPEEPSSVPVTASPNNNGRAWLQVVASFFLWFNSWGLVNAFGVYQTFYQLELLSSSTSSEISWIGSLQVSLLMVSAPVSTIQSSEGTN